MDTAPPPTFNSREQIQQLIQVQRITWGWPLFMLICRALLFAGFQALVALVLLIGGSRAPWLASIAWWPIVPVFANLVTIYLLSRLFLREGGRLTWLYKFQRGGVGKDLLIILGLLMFIPFALLTAALLYWRPRLLPYMLFIHFLMDLQLAISVLMT
jgi:hypothetical protein